jgi:hypothetical protein
VSAPREAALRAMLTTADRQQIADLQVVNSGADANA